ncbi:hypothetical protein OC846_002471 [Tilletia horrida]|uniref:J domain-containing protein n=1 Tax=Tilletia horrida TaxID=155126 RepID=A0AAN6JSL1_9BASI|nr:hypothetical protein OC846_002471 [Tilletia horrida]
MFVATSLARGAYKYAVGGASAHSQQDSDATPANTRVKRRAKRPTAGPSTPTSPDLAGSSTTPPPSYDEVQAQHERSAADLAKLQVIDSIIAEQDLYKVLGIRKNAKADEIRRAFLNRSRVCHPDKFPNYQPSTIAFQKVSFAYQTLSKPSSRRMYDVSGRTDFAAAMNNPAPGSFGAGGSAASGMSSDETLNSVLYSVFCEFMEGDFEMIRVLINALNEGNPGLNLGNDAADSLEGAFRRLRRMLLSGKKYLTIVRFELMRLYEIQHSLGQLSYFDVFGRLRLTLQLARVTLSIPMAIDQAMKEPSDDSEADDHEDDDPETNGQRSPGGKKRDAGEESESDISDDSDLQHRSPRAQKRGNDFGVVQSSDPEDQPDDDEAAEAEARRIRRQARYRAKAERERRRLARRANLEAATEESNSRTRRNSRVFQDGGSAANAHQGQTNPEGLTPFPTASGQRTPTPRSPRVDSDTSGKVQGSFSSNGKSPRDDTRFATSPRPSRTSTPYSTPLRSAHLTPSQSMDDTASPQSGSGLRPPFSHRRSRTTSTPTGFSPMSTPPSACRRSNLHPDDTHNIRRNGHGRSMSNAVPPTTTYASPSGSSTFSSGSFRRHADFGIHEEDTEEEDEEDMSRGSSYPASHTGSPKLNSGSTRSRGKEKDKRGLLGPTAAGLLKGVVKVLETSESWVPGAAAAAEKERNGA